MKRREAGGIGRGRWKKVKLAESSDSENSEEIERGQMGVIESISLCNFMCHDNLEFKFGPNVNFVIGKNGSGKSAILTALILVMGGRSNVTDRYSNIKGFIQNGKHKAKIELVLKNSGSRAYKPECYGSKVTVVREMNSDGVSSYKLKSEQGRIVSTQKEELNNILKAMDIQIENPVTVLTQEKSRSFLTARKPEKLYQYFYQGSGLEMLEINYCAIKEAIKEASAEIERKLELVPELEKNVKKFKKILDTSTKVRDYKRELFWANVIEIERQTLQKKEEYETTRTKLLTLKEDHENCQAKLAERTTSLAEFQKQREECDAVMTQYRNILTDLKSKKHDCSAELRNLEGKLSSFQREERGIHEELANLQNNINENLMKDQNDLNEVKNLRENQIKQLKNDLIHHSAVYQQLAKEWESKTKFKCHIESKKENLRSEKNSRIKDLEQQKKSLSVLKNTRINRDNVFGAKTQNVLNDIRNQASLFSIPPKGPIGRYLEVKDPKWNTAIDICISNYVLQSFCCNNLKDSLVLKEILKKHYSRIPTVNICQFSSTMYDISHKKAQTSYPTVLDMLIIRDPVIANFLIDLECIECKILIEGNNEAVSVMQDNPPVNCRGAYLVDGSNIALRPFRFYSNNKTQQPLLSVVGTEEIRKLEQSIASFEEELRHLESDLNSLESQYNLIPAEITALQQKILEKKQEMRKIQAKIEDLQIEEDTKNKHCMQEDLQQLQSDYERKKAEIQDHLPKVEKCKVMYSDMEKEIAENMKLLQEESEKHDHICAQLNNCGQDKETLALTVKKFPLEINEIEKNLVPLEKELDKCNRAVQLSMIDAENVGPRIETNRSSEVLRRLLSETEKVVEEASNCDREEILKQYREKLKKVVEVKKKLGEKEKIHKDMTRKFNTRILNFNSIRSHIQNIIQMSFVTYLKDRFEAKMVFDVKHKSLTLLARRKSDNKQSGNKGGKCSSLSGGERSIVTIAFLLAMWDRIKSPFKILDEYDVFMDSDNRKLSVDLLIAQAKIWSHFQFIFLSPLDLPNIKKSPLVKIHQMPEPLRSEEPSL